MTGLHGLLQCGFCGCLALEPKRNYVFALTSVSLRDLPFCMILDPIQHRLIFYDVPLFYQ